MPHRAFRRGACFAPFGHYVDSVTNSANHERVSDREVSHRPRTATRRWLLPILLGLVLVFVLLLRGSDVRQEESPPAGHAGEVEHGTADLADTAPRKTVVLMIDYGDGRPPKTESVSWSAGMTVRDLMNNVLQLSIRQQGTGATAFLSELDGVKNEGVGSRNWIYSVNGQHADRSFAIYELQPGDQVLWTFSPPQ